jgi:hypothetical protein
VFAFAIAVAADGQKIQTSAWSSLTVTHEHFLLLQPVGLDRVQEKPGSWWPDWDAWMKHHSNGTIPAPVQRGNAHYQPIETAPGRYVKQKSN